MSDDGNVKSIRRIYTHHLYKAVSADDTDITSDEVVKIVSSIEVTAERLKKISDLIKAIESDRPTHDDDTRAGFRLNFSKKLLFWQNQNSIEKPPGATVRLLAAKLFPKKFADEVLSNAIDDMQLEYIDAFAKGDLWHARWICVRGHLSFVLAVFTGTVGGVGRKIVDAWKGVNLS